MEKLLELQNKLLAIQYAIDDLFNIIETLKEEAQNDK